MPLRLFLRLPTLALIAACLLPAAQASAQEIHACIDAKGRKSYQNMPCAPEQRTASIRHYEAKSEDPAIASRTAAIQKEMDRRNHSSGKATIVRTGGTRRATGPTPCQAAKAKRKAMLDRVGLKRNFELLSQLDSEVWEVCKGF
ncbi:MAG: DUF4124 domain-containing protein [Lysobacter sp.]|nr:DUF4124 domain-containing protein [Lysobacter sp.]